jgi:hypothetical protein
MTDVSNSFSSIIGLFEGLKWHNIDFLFKGISDKEEESLVCNTSLCVRQ